MSTFATAPTIRRATVADASALAEVGGATFKETFGHLYPLEHLNHFLTTSHSVAKHAEVVATPRVAAWLAWLDGRPIGYATAGYCKLPVKDLEPNAGELRQLYVLGEFHKHKLGSKLLETAFDWMKSEGMGPLYIGVWSENHLAQRFYARYGFEKVAEYGFPVGDTIDREFILKQTRP
jgi:ribosomal protein S18 acetylase RimI-like enzyme